MNDTQPFYISQPQERKNTTTIVAVETTKKMQKIEIVVRNCQKPFRVVTIVPLQLLQSSSQEPGKGVGTTCPAFREEVRVLFPRIPESGRVSGLGLELF